MKTCHTDTDKSAADTIRTAFPENDDDKHDGLAR